MKSKQFMVIALLLLLTIGLSACERSASSAMPGAEGEESFPLPEAEVGTPSALEALEAITTQTAIVAESGGDQVAAPQAEEAAPVEEVKPTETPQPVAEPEAEPVEAEPQEEPEPEPEPVEVEEYSVPSQYTLQPGEFPYCIARRFDIAPATLLSANGLSHSSMTYPGTVLTIPQNAAHFNVGPRSLRHHPTTYVVRSGDTANSVACLFGDVDPRAIKAVNGIDGALPVGQTIQIP